MFAFILRLPAQAILDFRGNSAVDVRVLPAFAGAAYQSVAFSFVSTYTGSAPIPKPDFTSSTGPCRSA